jgi:hypothetical protein
VHALCSLNENTFKRQSTYENLLLLRSVVRPRDFMISLDVESVFFHVPIHPPQISKVLFVTSGSVTLCQQQVHRPAVRRLFCPYQTRPCVISSLGSNVPAPASPLSSSRRVLPFILFVGWTSSTRIWTIVMSAVSAEFHRHDMSMQITVCIQRF